MNENETGAVYILLMFMGFLLVMGMVVTWLVVRQENRKLVEKRRREDLNGPEPICGCGEHFSFHDPRTGRCMKEKEVATRWKPDPFDDGEAIPTRWEMRVCGCQRYTGPQPMAELYAQPFAFNSSVFPASEEPEPRPLNREFLEEQARQMRDAAPEEPPEPIQVNPGQERLRKQQDD